jgi:asparaginyl-tRNA synthetase
MSVRLIKNIDQFVGQEVTIKGWLYNKRSSGSIAFLEVRDGYGWVTAVVSKNEVSSEVWEKAEQVTQESSLIVEGIATEHPKKPGVFEIQVKNITLIQLAQDYPIAKKDHGPDFLMENRHLWLRSKQQWAILHVRDAIMMAIQDYLHRENFIRVDSPVFTPNACEGTTTLFPVPKSK